MVFGGRAVLTEAKPTGMQRMAGLLWAPMLLMGLMIIFASLGVSVVKANFASDFFGVPQAIREAADAPAYLIDKQQFIQTTNVWLPSFQLLGIGLILSAITFSLANILGVFRVGGVQIQQAFGKEPQTLTRPITGMLFPMMMLLGVMILVVNLIIAAVVAGIAWDVYGNPVAEINAAEPGSTLLRDQGTVETYRTWLEPFRFVGIATILVGISMAVHTILQVIRFQGQRIRELAEGR
ncbi:MAG: hypothetical protein ACE5KW_03585 [Dehalococcoidia bacterium]